MKAEISQIIHESTAMRPVILNKRGLVERLLKKQNIQAANETRAPTITKVLEAQVMFPPKRKIVSRTLESLDTEHELDKLEKALGVRSIRVGRKIAYHADANVLVLGAEGALGAAVMQRALPVETAAADPAVKAILEGSHLPINTTAQELGAAIMMVHLMQNGVDGLFFDLSIDMQFVEWLHAHRGAGLALAAKFEMQHMQLQLWKWVVKDAKSEEVQTQQP